MSRHEKIIKQVTKTDYNSITKKFSEQEESLREMFHENKVAVNLRQINRLEQTRLLNDIYSFD